MYRLNTRPRQGSSGSFAQSTVKGPLIAKEATVSESLAQKLLEKLTKAQTARRDSKG